MTKLAAISKIDQIMIVTRTQSKREAVTIETEIDMTDIIEAESGDSEQKKYEWKARQ